MQPDYFSSHVDSYEEWDFTQTYYFFLPDDHISSSRFNGEEIKDPYYFRDGLNIDPYPFVYISNGKYVENDNLFYICSRDNLAKQYEYLETKNYICEVSLPKRETNENEPSIDIKHIYPNGWKVSEFYLHMNTKISKHHFPWTPLDVQKNSNIFHHFLDKNVNNFSMEFLKECISYHGEIIKYFHKKNQSTRLKYCYKSNPSTRLTDELCWIAIKQSIKNIEYIPESFLTNEMCLFVVQHKEYCDEIKFIPFDKQTEEIILFSVQKHGFTLQFVQLDCCTKQIYHEAVKQDGLALKYIPNEKREISILIEAVNENANALRYIDPKDQTPQLCRIAHSRRKNVYEKRHQSLTYVHEIKKNDSYASICC